MKLVADWRRVLKRPWSIRAMIPAGILSGLEVIFSLPRSPTASTIRNGLVGRRRCPHSLGRARLKFTLGFKKD